MTVTSAPIGSTGQSLDGFAVNANVPDAFRESVVITDPSDPNGILSLVSTQPIQQYGVPVWMLGTPGVTIAGQVSTFPSSSFVTNLPTTTLVSVISTVPHTIVGTSQVFGSVSTQIVSSIPMLVAQSTSPWVVSTAPIALTGTTQVFGTVSTQIVSSLPLIVSQSTSAWQAQVTNTVNVNLTSSITQNNNISSSIPFFVAQSTSPWVVSGSTAVNFSSFVGLQNTTVPTGAVLNGMEVAVGLPSTTGPGNLQASLSDSAGRHVMVLYNQREQIGSQATSMSTAASTTETIIVSASSSVYRDLCMLLITTNGAGQGNWRLRPASATTTPAYIFNTPAAPGSILNILFQPPLPGQLNSNWTLQASNVSTTGHIVALFNNTQ